MGSRALAETCRDNAINFSVSIFRIFVPQALHEIIESAFAQHALKLRAVIAYDADVFDDDVVDFPTPLNPMQSVANSDWLAFAWNNFGIYLSPGVFCPLA